MNASGIAKWRRVALRLFTVAFLPDTPSKVILYSYLTTVVLVFILLSVDPHFGTDPAGIHTDESTTMTILQNRIIAFAQNVLSPAHSFVCPHTHPHTRIHSIIADIISIHLDMEPKRYTITVQKKG